MLFIVLTKCVTSNSLELISISLINSILNCFRMSQTETDDVVNKFINFYRNYCADDIADLAQKYPHEKRSLYIDHAELSTFDAELALDFINNPSFVRDRAEEALRLYDLPADVKLSNAHVRLINLPSTTSLRDIRVNDDVIGRLIAVKGIVRKGTDVQPKIIEAAYECQRCGTMTHIPQQGGSLQEPHECHGCERQGPFRLNFNQSEFIDAQKLRLQENPEGLRGGQTPKSIDVAVEDDITGEVTPGDNVTLIGILHIDRQDASNNSSQLFDMYIEGMSISIEDEEYDEMDISQDDEQEIQELANRDDIFDKMVASIAPSIYGYHTEKLAMVLQLFSGVRKQLPDGSKIRGDIHMLLIGDPGTGKSQLLSYIGDIAPRSVYTSGKGSSTAGLTAAAVQDDFGDGQNWTLEAGALVLADKGTAAVDELDKMQPSDRSAMHEALEQQQISIAKAGINATLKSRCSLLGAANPKYGRFDDYEPIAEQIDLEPALISRFDLIFTVTDTPDEEEDTELANHILQSNYAGEMNTHKNNTQTTQYSESEVSTASESVDPDISGETLRKYIAYAKRKYYPVMTDGARKKIRDFYVNLRVEGEGEDTPVPITARKLEGLVRLAEASARVRLSETVSESDAERAIDVVRACLEDIGIDPETGEFDVDVVETGHSKTQRDRIHDIKSLISDVAEEYENNNAPYDEVMDRLDEVGMDKMKAEKEIEKLKRKGELYEPSNNELSVT